MRCLTGRGEYGRRGLTLLELMLGMAIAAMVATAIAGMLHAVAVGASTQADVRSVMVRGSTAQTRAGSYLSTARCALQVDPNGGAIVIWQNDRRPSNSVHLTEVRMIVHDAESERVLLKFVSWPDGWTQAYQDMQDVELPASTDWIALLNALEQLKYVGSIPIVDGVTDMSVTLDAVACTDARLVYLDLAVETDAGARVVRVNSPILNHFEPEL